MNFKRLFLTVFAFLAICAGVVAFDRFWPELFNNFNNYASTHTWLIAIVIIAVVIYFFYYQIKHAYDADKDEDLF